MSSNYLVADLLSSIKNVRNRYIKRFAEVPYSAFSVRVLDLLKASGYIVGYEINEVRKGIKTISVAVRFDSQGMNVVSSVRMFSKPSRRFYVGLEELRSIVCRNKAGLAVVSTTKGVKAGSDALRSGLGGELICVLL